MEVLKVSAIIVTRGDVDLREIIESLPREWQLLIWDNGKGTFYGLRGEYGPAQDLAVYGRYAAIEYASGDLIYVQDDDVIVSDPQALVDKWGHTAMFRRSPNWDLGPGNEDPHGFLVANMPTEFRHDFYREHCLVGFGAVFHRDAPARAFKRFDDAGLTLWDIRAYYRTCDVVFTALTPRVLVDVSKRNLPWATAPNRMYMTGGQHVSERMRMLELARKVRDA